MNTLDLTAPASPLSSDDCAEIEDQLDELRTRNE